MIGRTWHVAVIVCVGLTVPLAPAVAAEASSANDSTAVASAASTATATTSGASLGAKRDSASAQREGEPRTLEDINIEGKIAVPQVLFITARDPRRFMGFQHRRYLKTSATIGDETPHPSWIARFAHTPTQATKETSP